MATNLVSQILNFLTPDMIGRIAAALGIDPNSAESAVRGAVPALLAGLAGIAARPQGAQKIAEAARRETDTVGNLAGMFDASDRTSIAEHGSQLLSSVLGGQKQDALTGVISEVAGLDRRSSGALLGTLAPVVMGAIGQQQGRGAADAAGIASLFAGQQENIAAAMPDGVRNLLGKSGLLDSLGGFAQSVTDTARHAARQGDGVARTAGAAQVQAAHASPSHARSWLYWLIPILAIAGVFLYFFGLNPQQPAVGESVASAPAVDAVEVDKQIRATIADLGTTLSGVTDVSSAQAALPRLQEATSQIDQVTAAVGRLSSEQRTAFTAIVSSLLPELDAIVAKAMAVPGVADVLKPTVDALTAKVSTLVS